MSTDKLQEALDEAEWTWLRDHAQRGVVIVVAPTLDILEVGRAVAADDTARVQAWIERGQLAKPTNEQQENWDAAPAQRFLTLVLRPYVLIQQPLKH